MDIVASTLCLILGITTPTIESSIQGLDHPTFQVRNKSDQYLRKDVSAVFRIWFASNVDGMTLERKMRIERLKDNLISNWSEEYQLFIWKKWDMEGQMVDLMFGDDWPSMRVLYHWEGVGYWTNRKHSNKPDCSKDDPGWVLFKKYWNEEVSYSVISRLYTYYHGLDKIKWSVSSLEKALTKVWVIDELNKGTDPKYIAILLHVMRNKTLLKENELWLWLSIQNDLERYNEPNK